MTHELERRAQWALQHYATAKPAELAAIIRELSARNAEMEQAAICWQFFKPDFDALTAFGKENADLLGLRCGDSILGGIVRFLHRLTAKGTA